MTTEEHLTIMAFIDRKEVADLEAEERRPRKRRKKLSDIESVPLKGRSHPYG